MQIERFCECMVAFTVQIRLTDFPVRTFFLLCVVNDLSKKSLPQRENDGEKSLDRHRKSSKCGANPKKRDKIKVNCIESPS